MGVILVEGDSEKFLLPTLARLHEPDFDFDEYGITVCSISGTNFGPYVQLLGQKGLNCPFVVLTDFDPVDEEVSQEDGDPDDEIQQDSYGATRVVNSIMLHLFPEDEWDEATFEEVLEAAPQHGVFVNEFTFEIDLFNSGAHKAFAVAIKDLTSNKKIHERFDALAEDPDAIDPKQLLKDINSVGKGRFAQRLGAVLQKDKLDVCPPYIADALSYLKGKLE